MTLTVNYTPPAVNNSGGIIYNNFDKDVVAINSSNSNKVF
jgi:hypothetical protein